MRWYRVLPVAVLVLAVAVCALVAAMPTTLGRQIHPVHHASSIRASAERHEVDPLLVCAIISCESGWDEGAVSSAGAVGLMQMMPDTVDTLVSLGFVDATAWNLQNLADPAVNIECGCALISYLQSQFSSVEEVVAAYNAGIGSVQGWLAGGGSIPESIQYPETRLYLEQVLVAYEGYQRSYPDGLPLI